MTDSNCVGNGQGAGSGNWTCSHAGVCKLVITVCSSCSGSPDYGLRGGGGGHCSNTSRSSSVRFSSVLFVSVFVCLFC